MCSLHPKYKLKRSPRTDCGHCWKEYADKFPERIKFTTPIVGNIPENVLERNPKEPNV